MNNVQTEQYYQTSGAEFNGGDELSASSSLRHLFEHLGQIIGEVWGDFGVKSSFALIFSAEKDSWLEFISTWLKHEKSELQSKVKMSTSKKWRALRSEAYSMYKPFIIIWQLWPKFWKF